MYLIAFGNLDNKKSNQDISKTIIARTLKLGQLIEDDFLNMISFSKNNQVMQVC